MLRDVRSLRPKLSNIEKSFFVGNLKFFMFVREVNVHGFITLKNCFKRWNKCVCFHEDANIF